MQRPAKRQRMSSPTYDEQVDLSQDDIAAFDQMQETLSQAHSRPQSPEKSSLNAREKRQRAIEEALRATHQPKGKENKHRRRPSSVSPAKISTIPSQPQLDPNSDNPFADSESSNYLYTFLSSMLTAGYRATYT